MLLVLLGRRLEEPMPVGATVGRALVAGGCTWAVATACSEVISVAGRPGAALEIAVAAPLAVMAGMAALWLLRTPELRRGRWIRSTRADLEGEPELARSHGRV